MTDDYELKQQIQRIKDATAKENQAKAEVEYELRMLGLNFPEVVAQMKEMDSESESASEAESVEVSTVDSMTKDLKKLMADQAPIAEIKAAQAELQEAINA